VQHAVSRAPGTATLLLAASALSVLAAGVLAESTPLVVAAIVMLVAAPIPLVEAIPWRVAIGALVLLIAFVPIKRYVFATGLPFQLEPYRLLVLLLLGGWVACVLVDERIRLRKTGLEGPILLISAATVGSVLANPERAADLQSEVLKSASFLLSFFLVFYLVATVIRSDGDADTILKTLISGIAVVGVLAIVESRTGLSPYGRMSDVFPLLHESAEEELVRGGGTRARGPAEHPIALSAALVMAVPLAFYLASTARTKRLWWWLAVGLTSLGALATLSRTGVMMLVVVALTYLMLRPRETIRFWPALIPALAVIHFALPGALGSIRASFFPEGGVIAEQQNPAASCTSSGRIADIGPTLDEVARQPLLGIGHGTRIVTGPDTNACILDNQWLGTLLETGIVGLIAWVLLFTLFIKLLSRAARRRNREGELSVALVAAVAAYAVGMFTFDALGFVQVTFILFLLLGVGASVLERNPGGDAMLAARPRDGFPPPAGRPA
jgi:hypothetical protein